MKMLNTISTDRAMLGNFESLIDGIIKANSPGESSYEPRWNVREEEKHFTANFDIPGVRREDLTIEIHGSKLHISGERKNYGRFERIFNLPATVDAEKIEALHEDGVLSVTIPKVETKVRSVKIQSSKEKELQ